MTLHAEGRQDMTGAELPALVTTPDQELRRIVAHAMLVKDWTARQLSVLINTYPLWYVERTRGLAGEVWWTARLRPPHEVTPEMLRAGLMPYAQEPDPIALAATLAWHTYLFQRWQARTAPPP